MFKTKINLSILLPEEPAQKDDCVNRLIEMMQQKEGIDKVHVVNKDGTEPQLCFHYDPSIITLDEVKRAAHTAGAALTAKYGHYITEVLGIRHVRHARSIEDSLKRTPGIYTVGVAPTGMIRIEFDPQETDEDKLANAIGRTGIRIKKEIYKKQDTPDHNEEQGDHKHEGDEQSHDHEHEHDGILGKNSELIFALICGALLGIGFALSFIKTISSFIPPGCYLAACFFGGFYTAKEAITAISKGEFEIDFLMLVAAIGAGILGKWQEGALLLFLFSLGHALEHFAMEKARRSIAALTDLAPKTALLKTGNDIQEVKIEALKVGDRILIRPNTKISADGIIVNGSGDVNQAPITGESIPVEKSFLNDNESDISKTDQVDAKHRVFAGSINGNGTLEVVVSKPATDSTISRLVKMVNEAQTQKSPTQQFTDKVEKYFVPAVLILVIVLCFAFLVIDETFSDSFYRAMAVLVAASPCALAIATPSAVLSGVARAARAGVLIKGGRPLEELGTLSALAFDKTGTLTEGKPKLTAIVPLTGISEDELLKQAMAIEALSDHPIAKAIIRDGKEKLKDQAIPQAQDLQAVLGKGIKATLDGQTIYMGNLALFESLDDKKPSAGINNKVKELEQKGNTTMLVRRNDEYTGIIAVMDTPREEAKHALGQLKETGIKRMIMLTGDNQQVAEAVAEQTGITDAWGGLLPEQKVEAIKKLKTEHKQVAMVGDGVNDAPAMANSTVGIAMGAAGSDVALETADIALMGDKLSLLPFAIGLSRKAKGVIKQNLWISLGMVAVLIPLTILGIASIGPAVMAHEGSTLIVVFNALRLLAYKRMDN